MQRTNKRLKQVDKEILNFYSMNGSMAGRTREPLSSGLMNEVQKELPQSITVVGGFNNSLQNSSLEFNVRDLINNSSTQFNGHHASSTMSLANSLVHKS